MKKYSLILVSLSLLAFFLFAGCDDGGSSGNPKPDGDLDSNETLPEEDQSEEEITDNFDGETEGEDEQINQLISKGIFWLENGEMTLANDVFKQAYDLDPYNRQARFGYAFSESGIGFEIFSGLILQTIFGLVLPTEAQETMKANVEPDDPPDFNTWFDGTFQDALELVNGRFKKAIELYTPLKANGGLSMRFTHLPIFIGLKERTYFAGEIDDADVFVFDGMCRTFSLLLDVLASHSLKTDMSTAIPKVQLGLDGDLNLDGILKVVVYLVQADEGFLAFREGGAAKIKATGDLLMEALLDIESAMAAVAEEEKSDKDQTDELFTLKKKNDEVTLVLNISTASDQEKLAVKIVPPDVMDAVNAVKTQIKDGGDPVPMTSGVLPLVASAAVVAVAFGLLDMIGVDIGLDASMLTPAVLTTLIGTFVKLDSLALDMNAYYKNPKAIRAMLPIWTTDKPLWENTFPMEWECPEETGPNGATPEGLPDGSGSFLCAGTAETLVDSVHFSGKPYEIPADGLTLKTPHIPMQDPSFGGLLYVDVKSLGLTGYPETPKFQKADLRSFNAALGKVLEKIGD